MEYTQAIDELIAQLLGSRSYVLPQNLAGIPDEEGARFLGHYADLHGSDGSVVWDGVALRRVRHSTSETVSSRERPGETPSASSGPRESPSPVDQILSAPVGRSLLDSKPAGGAVPGWMWLLPLTLLLPGGVLAWWMTRDTNRTIARLLLVTGLVMTVVTVFTVRAGAAYMDVAEKAMRSMP